MKINVARIFETLKKDWELIFVKFSLEAQVTCSKWIHPVLKGTLEIIQSKCLQRLKRVWKSL